ncbi:hypothetical protein INO15_13825, partial [Staphylococcus aureus]|nr:hypothetical protein [Staphylococcus aureus]
MGDLDQWHDDASANETRPTSMSSLSNGKSLPGGYGAHDVTLDVHDVDRALANGAAVSPSQRSSDQSRMQTTSASQSQSQ